LDLFLKDGDNVAGGVAGLEPGCKGMGKQIILCAFFVGVQGIIDD